MFLRLIMIAKVYEEYEYNNITKKYDGEFS